MNKRLIEAKILSIGILVLVLFNQSDLLSSKGVILFMEFTGMLFLCSAAAGRIWSLSYISGRKSEELIQEGPYSITRNPLYLFSFIGFIGAGLVFGSFVITILLGITFFITHWRTILKEEEYLRDRFGEVFDGYITKTPRFLPDFKSYHSRDEILLRPIKFSKAIIDSSAIPLVLVLSHAIQWFQSSLNFPVLFKLY